MPTPFTRERSRGLMWAAYPSRSSFMLFKFSARKVIASCGIKGLGSGLRVDGLGNGGNFAAVVFAVGFFAVAVFGFAFAIFGFAFACAIGFDLCAVAFFAVTGD